MAGSYPDLNDREFDLWVKIAWNWYDYLVDFGGSGLTPPSLNDRLFDLQKKVCYYTAYAVDLHP